MSGTREEYEERDAPEFGAMILKMRNKSKLGNLNMKIINTFSVFVSRVVLMKIMSRRGVKADEKF